MNTINVKRLGLAFGITGAILYLGCMVLMAIAGRNGTIKVFNSLLHGMDTAPIIRMNIPWWESLIGIGETFALAGLIGVCVATIYNATIKKNK